MMQDIGCIFVSSSGKMFPGSIPTQPGSIPGADLGSVTTNQRQHTKIIFSQY